jgi:hypothetical protein
VGQAAGHLADRRDFSPRPDRWQGGGNIGQARKRRAPGMQEDQVGRTGGNV